jgi:hypothetical protein
MLHHQDVQQQLVAVSQMQPPSQQLPSQAPKPAEPETLESILTPQALESIMSPQLKAKLQAHHSLFNIPQDSENDPEATDIDSD